MNLSANHAPQVVRAACPHDCPDTCAMLVTVENGVATAVKGDPDHPPTSGVLCNKVSRYLERTYAKDRVLTPLKRAGKKGEGKFERISCDEALDTIAAKFKTLAAENPQTILPYSYAGTMGLVQGSSIDRRFFHTLGASLLDRTICSSAGKEGFALTVGSNIGPEMERFEEAKLIILWGTNPITSSVHLWTRIQTAKRNGAKLIAIDPYRSLSAEKCDQHIAPLPGTDAALALGVMHILVRDGLIDQDYIANYTLGFEMLKKRLEEWPPERASEVCGISTEIIEGLARDYGTIKPAVIRVNYGANRTAGGGMAIRTIACLPALTGAWRDAAGGVMLGSGGVYPVDQKALERPDLIWNQPRTINMSLLGDALTATTGLPVKAMYVYNSNPATVAPDSSKVLHGLAREDLFTVVHDVFLTDTADYADIVLPATTQLEHTDIHKSYGHTTWVYNNAAIAPVGEAKRNTEVFRLLARRMGMTDPALYEDDETVARAALDMTHERNQGVSFERMKAEGWQRVNIPVRFAPFAKGNFPTPSGKCEFYSERARAMGLDPLPTYIPPRESAATAPELAKRFPLAMISPPTRNFMNSTFVNIESLRREEKEPHLDIHPIDAAARMLEEGHLVRVFNDRGAFFAKARINTKSRQGMVTALSLWWHKLSIGGFNANAVTSQQLTDMGRGPTFYDCLVEIEKAPVP